MGKLKRIILTVTNDLNYDQRMHRICGSLHSSGYEVMLIGRYRRKSSPLNAKPYQQHRLQCVFETGKLFYIEYNVRLFLFLLFQPHDIVCSIDLDTILPGYFSSLFKGTKKVYDAHEHFTQVPEVIHRNLVQRIWKGVERFTVPRMHLCYTVSQSIADYMKDAYNCQFEVILNVPLKTPLAKKEDQEPYLLYQGALNKGRGLEELLEAMHLIDCRLLIAGEGDLSADLRVKVRELGLHPKVKFLGMLEPDALRKVTRNAYLGINLLDGESLNYYYSLANKFFDYLHVAVPAVNMNFPEYRRINEEMAVGVLVDDLTESSIVGAIKTILLDEDLHEKFVENCLVMRKRYNWQLESEKLLQLYRRFD